MSKPRKTNPRARTKYAEDYSHSPPPPPPKPVLRARNAAQREAITAFKTHPILILLGSAGSGKTFIATQLACNAVATGECDRVVITRPQQELDGNKMGYLPGGADEKMHPWIMPFQDVLTTMVGPRDAPKELAKFEVLPLPYIRGRTLSNCVAILDECQNCSLSELYAYATRLGDEPRQGRMIWCGDPKQSDLPDGSDDLLDFADELEHAGVAKVISFTSAMIVRSKWIEKIEVAREALNDND